MEKVAIVYGSSTGDTEKAALMIAEKLGKGNAELFNVKEITVSRLGEYKNLIFGVSTWGIGELQVDWQVFMDGLCRADLKGKAIALFGPGDAESYPDSFVDGMGIVYEALKDKGCRIIGRTETKEYSFDHSKAVYDGMFIGLPLDENNESELTEQRIDKWLSIITPQFN